MSYLIVFFDIFLRILQKRRVKGYIMVEAQVTRKRSHEQRNDLGGECWYRCSGTWRVHLGWKPWDGRGFGSHLQRGGNKATGSDKCRTIADQRAAVEPGTSACVRKQEQWLEKRKTRETQRRKIVQGQMP